MNYAPQNTSIARIARLAHAQNENYLNSQSSNTELHN